MQRKSKHAKRNQRKISAKHRPALPYALPERHTSYETALLKNIVARRDSGRVSKHALAFYSLMANATPSLRILNYKHGIAVGRSLYRLYAEKKRYSLYEESVSDLVSFFELAGLGRITYHAFPDKIRIGMHDTLHLDLGMSTHSFEAGTIAGFLTASKGQLMNVTENVCSSNLADLCEFHSSNSIQEKGDFAIKAAFDTFMADVSKQVLDEGETQNIIANEYYVLSSLVLLDSKYFHEMRVIADYLGGRLATELGIESMTPKRMLNTMERSITLLNMGVVKIKTSGKFDVTLKFSKLHSRKAFADLSIAFLHGLLRNSIKGASMKAKCLIRNNTYTVKFSKSKQTKRVH